MPDDAPAVLDGLLKHMPDLEELYRELHRHPELSFQETATAAEVARRLTAHGYEVTTGVAQTGVVGVLRNGDGPVVMLRADMDALPVLEETDLPYRSTRTAQNAKGETVPVMHACGHDLHVVCLLAACAAFADNRPAWSGTLVVVFQPGEESGYGAKRLVDDGLFERFPKPDVILGQHVAPAPAGIVAHCPGTILGAADGISVRLYGRGGHGSKPESAVDPVVMAASFVLRLQTIVSRQVSPQAAAVVTVGKLHAGTLDSVIPSVAELEVNVRTFNPQVRTQVLAAIERLAKAEAVAAGAPQEPDVTVMYSLPTTDNDPETTERVIASHVARFDAGRVIRIGPASASEDFGILAAAAGAPAVFWFFGGTDAETYLTAAAAGRVDQDVPLNHSSTFAPVIQPTLTIGAEALVSAAASWLSPSDASVPPDS
jgi:hippurate hydrolase